ncbi:AAA family ATPase [Methylobacterium sp. WL8]|uniref:AAA family ATPase n=1 Tax=Methylobacterium sp. WL8 TaxID=2603899 RepID=UPI0011CB0027|nr:AAA family ATPase [Methylobacterium sp. WL8]TXN81491.1 AAA family ATPase [Methylobacterium sp. WL8]
MLPNSTNSIDQHPDTRPLDALARAFLRTLAKEERGNLKLLRDVGFGLGHDDEADDPVERILAKTEGEKKTEHVPIPADLAAVAVLVARAIEAEDGLVRRLRREAPVVVITTHLPDLVEPVRDVLEKCAFRPGVKAMDLSGSRPAALKPTQVGLLIRDGSYKEHRPDVGNLMMASALHARVPIVGCAPDPTRQLPRDLLRAAEHRIVLPCLDQSALDLVIEAVTGGCSTRRIDPDLVRTLDIADLPIAFRGATSPDACIDALARVTAAKADYLQTGPALEDLDGYGAAKDWGLALATDLQSYRVGRLAWADIDNRGLLLSGPPGVGKTSFARALAKSARVPLVATSVAEWCASDYLSGTLQAIRRVFAQARTQAPCILFIDELDGISDRAQIRGDHVQYWTQIVNLFLELLAGVEERPGVVVVAATNHPDRIDPAVKRAGRLDREIAIERPDTTSLARIFRHHLGVDELAGDSLMPLALAARGRTGADVEAFVRRAKGAARRAGRRIGLDDVLAEVRQGRLAMPPATRWRTAIHEAGHAIVGRVLGCGTIVDVLLHDGGGQAQFKHDVDGSATLPQLEAVLAMLLAGGVAEEIELGAACIGSGSGPGSDLAQATTIAGDIELRFGLGKLGPFYVAPSDSHLFLVNGLLEAVTDRLRRARDRSRTVLEARSTELHAIASELAEAGYLSVVDIDRLMPNHDAFAPTELTSVPALNRGAA